MPTSAIPPFSRQLLSLNNLLPNVWNPIRSSQTFHYQSAVGELKPNLSKLIVT